MCISIPPSIPHFGTTFGTTCTMYHFDNPLGTTPSTISVDQVDLCGMYNLVSDNSSGNIPPPPCHLYISCGCVVCSGMIAAVNLPLTFLYSIVWKTPHPPTLHHSQIFLIQSLASPCVDELYMFVAFITVSNNSCQLAFYIIIIFRV